MKHSHERKQKRTKRGWGTFRWWYRSAPKERKQWGKVKGRGGWSMLKCRAILRTFWQEHQWASQPIRAALHLPGMNLPTYSYQLEAAWGKCSSTLTWRCFQRDHCSLCSLQLMIDHRKVCSLLHLLGMAQSHYSWGSWMLRPLYVELTLSHGPKWAICLLVFFRDKNHIIRLCCRPVFSTVYCTL